MYDGPNVSIPLGYRCCGDSWKDIATVLLTRREHNANMELDIKMHIYKVPLVLTRQPEGGYTVTSPLLPELVTEGDTIDEALMHVQDAVQALVELYEDLGKSLPASLRQPAEAEAIQFEYAVAVP